MSQLDKTNINNDGLTNFGSLFKHVIEGKSALELETVNNLFKRDPELFNSKLPKTILISGLPRTGTTFLYNMLSKNERALFFNRIELLNPSFYTLDDVEKLKILKKMDFFHKVLNKTNPKLKYIHLPELEDPDEDDWLLSFKNASIPHNLIFGNFSKLYSILEGVDSQENYSFYEAAIRTLLYSKYKENIGDSFLLLKAPGHGPFLEKMDQIFKPIFVFTYRNPVNQLESLLKLFYEYNRIISVNFVDKKYRAYCGRQILEFSKCFYEKTEKQKALLNNESIIHASNYDLRNNHKKVVNTILDKADVCFSEKYEELLSFDLGNKNPDTNQVDFFDFFCLDKDYINKCFYEYFKSYHEFF